MKHLSKIFILILSILFIGCNSTNDSELVNPSNVQENNTVNSNTNPSDILQDYYDGLNNINDSIYASLSNNTRSNILQDLHDLCII